MATTRRCWKYLDGCRKEATGSTRVGSMIYQHCPDHDIKPLCAIDVEDVAYDAPVTQAWHELLMCYKYLSLRGAAE